MEQVEGGGAGGAGGGTGSGVGFYLSCRATTHGCSLFGCRTMADVGGGCLSGSTRYSTPGSGSPLACLKGRVMAGVRFNSFTCPNCNALYQLVRVEAGHETGQREPTCRSCGAPLPSREGVFALKYFLLRNAGRVQRSSAALGQEVRTCSMFFWTSAGSE